MRNNGTYKFTTPSALTAFYRKLGFKAREIFQMLKNTKKNAISLPLFPGLTEDQQIRVMNLFKLSLK